VNLDYLPRMRTVQTSPQSRGQVYVPAINWFLLVACLGLVFAFGSSSRLAAAYGVAVTLTMAITTLLVAVVARDLWRWSRFRAVVVLAPLLVVDLAFLAANIFKIPSGGWFPLVVGAAGYGLFTTWCTGRALVSARLDRTRLSVSDFVEELAADPPTRHPGTGVYLHRQPGSVAPTLLTNLRHNESLHETIVFLSITTVDKAHTHPAERDRWKHHPLGFHQLELLYGFTDQPQLSRDLAALIGQGVSFDPAGTTFFLGREHVEATDRPGMATWRERLFGYLLRNASDPTRHFGLPASRSVDIGTHVDI
jgi:KUP system potassium uptake protein